LSKPKNFEGYYLIIWDNIQSHLLFCRWGEKKRIQWYIDFDS